MNPKFFFTFVALFSSMLITGCKDDKFMNDDMFMEMPAGEPTMTIEELTGYVGVGNEKWLIYYHIPNTIDAFYNFYPVNMNKKFCWPGCKVIFSGKAYKNDLGSNMAGMDGSFTIVLTSIEEVKE